MGFGDFFLGIVSKTASALIILLIGLISGRIIGRLFTLALMAYDAETHLRRIGGSKAAFFIGGALSYAIYFYTAYIALKVFGIEGVASVIAAGIVVLLILASAFLGARDIFLNLLSYLTTDYGFRKGDFVSFSGVKGRVIAMDSQKVRVVTREGDVLVLPNYGISDMGVRKIRNI